MANKTKAERELEQRMLAVEDPVEMKTEPGTEILIGTDEHDAPEDPMEVSDHWERDHDTRATEHSRQGEVRVRGLGQVSQSNKRH